MKYQNPIIKGFHPDPKYLPCWGGLLSGDKLYGIFSGLPLFHSGDLVNWEQIGNCIDRNGQMDLKDVCDSGGIWAPTIRYDSGKFYVTATLEPYGNFIISAENPRGRWSDPIRVQMGGIDPSLYFENGKAYYCTNLSLHPGEEEITLAEIDTATGGMHKPGQNDMVRHRRRPSGRTAYLFYRGVVLSAGGGGRNEF